MSTAFSNTMLARFAVTMAIGLGAGTYGYVGIAPPQTEPVLSPILAAAVSYAVAAVTFFVGFGLLSMHWFGQNYWAISAIWGFLWLVPYYFLGREWLEPMGLAFTFLTVLMISVTIPKGGLSLPGKQWKTGRRD